MFNQAQCVITLFSRTFLKIDVYESPEETENLVKRFVSETLQIDENIDLYVAHRLRPRPDKKTIYTNALKNISYILIYIHDKSQ